MRGRGLQDGIVHFESHSPDTAFASATSPKGHAHSHHGPLLDSKGAAALLNVPATWVLAEARADRIPHVRLGRYVRFDAVELRTWWLSRRRGPWRSHGRPGETAGAPTARIERVT